MTDRDNLDVALGEAAEAIVASRALLVDQNELWSGLERDETEAVLEHFGRAEIQSGLVAKASVTVTVVGSSDPRALGLRNRATGERPSLLVVVEQRWDDKGADQGQSLQDLKRKLPFHLLAESVRFPVEEARLAEAASDTERAWVEALFRVLRGQSPHLVTDRDGQRMRLGFGQYLRFVRDGAAASSGSVALALAAAFHRLGLFTHPALAQDAADDRQDRERRIADALTQNYRAARDPNGLVEGLASQYRLPIDVFRDYERRGGKLTSSVANAERARDAFAQFLQDGPIEPALPLVEWDFQESSQTEKAKRGGRKRRHGIRGLLQDRDSLDLRKQAILDLLARDEDAGQRKETEALLDRLSQASQADSARGQLKTRAYDRLGSDPQRAKDLTRVLELLDSVVSRAKKKRDDIRSDSLTAALVEFAAWVRDVETVPPDVAGWKLSIEGKATPIRPEDPEWLRGVHRDIATAFSARRDEELAEDEDGEGDLFVTLEAQAGSRKRTIELHAPGCWADPAWLGKLGAFRLEFDDDGADPLGFTTASEVGARGQQLDPVHVKVRSLARTLHVAAPLYLPEVAEAIQAYGTAIAGVARDQSAERQRRIEELAARIAAAPAQAATLALELQAVMATPTPGGVVLDDETRFALARFQTLLPASASDRSAAQGPGRGYMMPFHPLQLRARYVADRLGLSLLSGLMDPARRWTPQQLVMAEAALDDVGVPAPAQVLAPWSHADRWPLLLFQELDRGFATFAPPEASTASFGRRQVARLVRDYLMLYPTAKDRLSLYVEADDDGVFAYVMATALAAANSGPALVDGLELRLAGDVDGDFPVLADRAANRAGLDEALFGVARGRLRPRVVFRLEPLAEHPPEGRACHLAVVYAGKKRAGGTPFLREQLEARPKTALQAERDALSLEALVEPPRVIKDGERLGVLGARDVLEQTWEELQGRVHWGKTGHELVRTVNLAPEQNGALLRKLHSMADWVITVSELPVHRALEGFDRKVVRLIDRKRFFEGGQFGYFSVSTMHSGVIEELLGGALKNLLGRPPTSLDPLINFLQKFSPGLAMRCVADPNGLGPRGILGLILTARTTRNVPGTVTLPLDEHPWLYGYSGLRADVLAVKPVGEEVVLSVLESKYTEGSGGRGAVTKKAQEQAEKSAGALREWMELSELSPLFRSRLYDTLIVHGAPDDATGVARRVLGGAPIRVDESSSVHVWTWDEKPATSPTTNGVHVHTLEETRAEVEDLLATVP
jgi:hypothetical protein